MASGPYRQLTPEVEPTNQETPIDVPEAAAAAEVLSSFTQSTRRFTFCIMVFSVGTMPVLMHLEHPLLDSAHVATVSLLVSLGLIRQSLSSERFRLLWALLINGMMLLRVCVLAYMPASNISQVVDSTQQPEQMMTALTGFAGVAIFHATMPASLLWKLASLVLFALLVWSVGVVAYLRTGTATAVHQTLYFILCLVVTFAIAQSAADVVSGALKALQTKLVSAFRVTLHAEQRQRQAAELASDEAQRQMQEAQHQMQEAQRAERDAREEVETARACNHYHSFLSSRTEWSRDRRIRRPEASPWQSPVEDQQRHESSCKPHASPSGSSHSVEPTAPCARGQEAAVAADAALHYHPSPDERVGAG